MPLLGHLKTFRMIFDEVIRLVVPAVPWAYHSFCHDKQRSHIYENHKEDEKSVILGDELFIGQRQEGKRVFVFGIGRVGSVRVRSLGTDAYRRVNSIFDSGPVTMEMRFRIPATFSAPDTTAALSSGAAQNVLGIIANSKEVAGFLNTNTFQVFHGDNAGSHSFTNFPTDGTSFHTVRIIKHANQTFEVFLDNNLLGTFPPRDISFL
ncbi:hypothetical protein MYX84_14935 [Acidobacteria bacterium AH-259-O06]|nr:hypothetical protein [Acidobacteria bacterium AH-259-O06]